jgi:predicted aspartyl protease
VITYRNSYLYYSSIARALLAYVVSILFFLTPVSCETIKVSSNNPALGKDAIVDRTELEFDFSDGAIVVPLAIGESEAAYRFLIDTGSSITAISASVRNELSLPSGKSVRVSDGVRRETLEWIRLPDVRMGSFVIEGLEAAVVDFDSNPAVAAIGIHGIIGLDVLRLFDRLAIDFERGRMIVSGSGGQIENGPVGGYSVPLKAGRNGLLAARAVIDGRVECDFIVDTGALGVAFWSDPATLKKLTARQAGAPRLEIDGTVVIGAFGDAGGYSELLRAASIRIGEFEIERPVILFSDARPPILGTGMLRFFRVAFDWRRNEMTLLPIPGRAFVPDTGTFGFNANVNKADSSLYISALARGGPAALSGLALGDRILSMNGEPCLTVDPRRFFDLAVSPSGPMKIGSELDIVAERDGIRKSVRLSKFFFGD